MYIVVDVWAGESSAIVPNNSASGITISDDGEFVPRINLFLGHTASEMEYNRQRIDAAIQEVIKAKALEEGEVVGPGG